MHCTLNQFREISPYSSKLCKRFDGRHWTGLLISHRLSMNWAMDCMDGTVDGTVDGTMDGTMDETVDWSVDWSVGGVD